MAKITYLLGAGASADTIPIVSNMLQRMREITNYIKSFLTQVNQNESKLLKNIHSDLLWLIHESTDYYSIDTLAKKYYLTNDKKDYERLKKTLVLYFVIEQFFFVPVVANKKDYTFSKTIDKRYDSFIATIANRSGNNFLLNNNIKILSWNYDIQLELSLQRFTNKTITAVKQAYQIFPLLNTQEGNHSTDLEKFSMRKLNGNAIFTTSTNNIDGDITLFDNINVKTEKKKLSLLLDTLKMFDSNNNVAIRFLNFSWDSIKNALGRVNALYHINLEESEKISEQTEILVVIGYSFPIFNREIDNKLFNKMINLRKVYIQDKNPEKIKSTMINAFEILQRTKEKPNKKSVTTANISTEVIEVPLVEILLETNTDQFVIPYELDLSN